MVDKKILKEVFEIPEPKIKQEDCNQSCGCEGKKPQEQDKELEVEINKYLDEVKSQVNKPKEIKQPRKHLITPEGKAKMLENIEKAREKRKQNIENTRIKSQPDIKQEVKQPDIKQPEPETQKREVPQSQPTRTEPIVSKVATETPKQIVIPVIPVIIQPKYIIKSTFKKAPWVK